MNPGHFIRIGDRLLDLSMPVVMGILNVTPDSFFSGSRIPSEKVVEEASLMLEEGAAILDIGGYSTRPGAQEVSVKEELARVVPAISAVRIAFPDCVISVDTFRSLVAKEAVDAGANIINDVSGGNLDHHMFEMVAQLKVPYILMHSKGDPKTMQSLVNYDNLLNDLIYYFGQKLGELKQLGVYDVIIDLGFGFAKTIDQNFELLRNLEAFTLLGQPVLAGLSRKSMIWKTLNTTAEHALNGTTALHMLALQGGASILRVHDVKAATETITLWKKACLLE